ncbi:hypothetical protein [Granulicella sp. L60]|uniref:hypothetical protein n=1 Tax=Granulicella sp. L60 TaxID=1641866 RepID=UPI00131E8C0A|nr:hypothetical protein [Granulicella sp. L60]
MNDLPEGFTVGSLYCFPVGLPKDATFAVISSTPTLETSQGKAKVTLLSMPTGAVLTCEASWQPDPAALLAVQKEIANRYPGLTSPTVNPATLENVTATLTVAVPGAPAVTIGPNPASGTSSNRAVFSGSLTTPAAQAVAQALTGEQGIFILSYSGALTLEESASATATGDLTTTIKSLAPTPAEPSSGGFFSRKKPDPPPPPPITQQARVAALEAAIARGSLKLVESNTPHVSPALVQQVAQKLRDKLDTIIGDKLTQLGSDAQYLKTFPINLSLSLPERRTLNFTCSVDVATLIAPSTPGT